MNFPPINPTSPRAATSFLIERQQLTTDRNVDFYNIPQQFNHLEIRMSGRGVKASAFQDMYLRFNGDTGANYTGQWWGVLNTTFQAGTANAQTLGFCGQYAGNTSTAGIYGIGRIEIHDYANVNPVGGGGAAQFKRWRAVSGANTGVVANTSQYTISGYWLTNNKPINQISIFGLADVIQAGSTLELYGIL